MAGIPLTFRGVSRSFAVITGHFNTGSNVEWEHYATIDTLVVLMGVKHRALIAQRLIHGGRSTQHPAAFIERGSSESQRVIETVLGPIAAGEVHVESPAVFIIGEVVRYRSELIPV